MDSFTPLAINIVLKKDMFEEEKMTLGEELRAMSDKAHDDDIQRMIEHLIKLCRIKAQTGKYSCTTTKYELLDKKESKNIKKYFAKEGIKFWQKIELGLYHDSVVTHVKW